MCHRFASLCRCFLILFILQLVSSAESMSSKVCAVFGYGPGLGAAVARKWAKEGFSVAVMSRSLDKVKAAESEITGAKG